MSSILGPTLAALLLLTAWIPFVLACAPTWQPGTFYAYGWAAPGLAFILFWSQIRRLQFGRAFQTRRFRPGDSSLVVILMWTVIVLLAGASALALRLIETTDPFWRLPLVLQAVWSATVCLILSGLLLGAPGARMLIGSQVVIAAATPLPLFLENGILLPLHAALGHVAALGLNFSGNPALLTGTDLLQATQLFSLNEVFGGVNSFPAAVLFALFFGEWFRLAFIPRAFLILLALVSATLGNLARVLWTFPAGPESAGANYALGLTLALLLIAAALLRRPERDSLNPLPVLRGSPAFFFLILAWPTAELIHHFWGKELAAHRPETWIKELPPEPRSHPKTLADPPAAD